MNPASTVRPEALALSDLILQSAPPAEASRAPPSYANAAVVPIHLDIRAEGVQLLDSFLWPLHDAALTPELYARCLCQDSGFPQTLAPLVAKSIKTQVDNYRLHDLLQSASARNREHLVNIVLHVQVNDMCLSDQFQWELTNPDNDPEEFAWSLCAELGLGPEFAIAAAHSIREQLNEHAAALLEGRGVTEAPVTSHTVIREAGEISSGQWCPKLSEASAGSVQRLQKVSYVQAKKEAPSAVKAATAVFHADQEAVIAVSVELRKLKMSQVALAQELGVPQPYVSNWLSGRMPQGASLSSMTQKMRQWLIQRGVPCPSNRKHWITS